MRKFLSIFVLELRALVRSKTVAILFVATLAWLYVFRFLVRGDGTADGAREMYLHYSLGGAFALLVIALLASATGSLARERAAKRLQLTMIRPVRYTAIALAKTAAHVAVGAAVLLADVLAVACVFDCSRPCNHVLSPVLPSPAEEAKAMYETYMKDPETPDAVKKAKKSIVLRLLTQRAVDHYQTIPTNSTAAWKFRTGDFPAVDGRPAVRMRFTNQFEMRREVRGAFELDDIGTSVSNFTQAVLTVPLENPSIRRFGDSSDEGGGTVGLKFRNEGGSSLMLRPRKDVELLLPADGFGWNLVRAYLELVSVLALVIAFGTLLSAGLGRPVALFTAFVTLIVGEISPSVVEQYPDELETNAVDRIGLYITRTAAEITRPVWSLSPLAALAKDECVEPREVARIAAVDLVGIPLLFSLVAALMLPRKQEEQS